MFWYLSTSVVVIFVREISKPSSFFKILIRILSEIRILGSDTNSNLKSFTSSKFCNNFDRNSIRKTSWLRLITISMWSAIRIKKNELNKFIKFQGDQHKSPWDFPLKFSLIIPVGLLQTPSKFQKNFQSKTSY